MQGLKFKIMNYMYLKTKVIAKSTKTKVIAKSTKWVTRCKIPVVCALCTAAACTLLLLYTVHTKDNVPYGERIKLISRKNRCL